MLSSRMFIMMALITLSALIVSCANVNSVHRVFRVSEGNGALIDIKQRAILVSKNVTSGGVIVCAEPSPDALSAYAAELAAKAELPNEIAVQISGAIQESASFTGLRTQSIQLLRDSQYRICEAYMNGAISESQYDLLARRYQKQTVALLAIEQLTGAIRAPSVVVNSSGKAEAARSVSDMRREIGFIDRSITELEKKKNDKALSDDNKKTIDENIKALQTDKEAISKGIEGAHGVLASGAATATISSAGLPIQRSDQHIQTVAQIVEKIVKSITDADDFGQLCFSYMQQNVSDLSDSASQLQNFCAEAIRLDQQVKKQQLEAIKAELKYIDSSTMDSSTKAQETKKLSDRLNQLNYGMKMLYLPHSSFALSND